MTVTVTTAMSPDTDAEIDEDIKLEEGMLV